MLHHLYRGAIYGAIGGAALYAYWRFQLGRTWTVGSADGPIKVPTVFA